MIWPSELAELERSCSHPAAQRDLPGLPAAEHDTWPPNDPGKPASHKAGINKLRISFARRIMFLSTPFVLKRSMPHRTKPSELLTP